MGPDPFLASQVLAARTVATATWVGWFAGGVGAHCVGRNPERWCSKRSRREHADGFGVPLHELGQASGGISSGERIFKNSSGGMASGTAMM